MGNLRSIAFVACLLPVLAAALAGCGGGDSGGDSTAAPSGGAKAVEIEDFAYEPATVTVPQGTEVVFTNHDSSPHTATSKESGLFETETIRKGESDGVVLDEAGSFVFYCAFHPFMKGKIVVE